MSLTEGVDCSNKILLDDHGLANGCFYRISSRKSIKVWYLNKKGVWKSYIVPSNYTFRDSQYQFISDFKDNSDLYICFHSYSGKAEYRFTYLYIKLTDIKIICGGLPIFTDSINDIDWVNQCLKYKGQEYKKRPFSRR